MSMIQVAHVGIGISGQEGMQVNRQAKTLRCRTIYKCVTFFIYLFSAIELSITE